MCQYLCKLNTDLTWGNFQMDYDDGWVALRTSFPLKALRLSRRVIASLVLTGFRTMDDHVQGLLTVASGQATVKKKRRRLAQHASARRSRPCDGNTQPVSKDYRALRQHRVEQFAEYLRRMGKRAHEEVGGACFMIFETPIEGAENVRGESLSDRTVQFVFEQNWFAVDLPNTSLLPGEAERIVRSRPGFYREAETPEANVSQTQDVVEYDPIGKKYTYGDEQEASEDAAWLLYDALNLSLNAEIRVRAADFEGEHEYEDGELLP